MLLHTLSNITICPFTTYLALLKETENPDAVLLSPGNTHSL